MGREFVEDNQASRLKLQELASRLSDEDFNQTVSGWSLSAWFCHLAFWDRVILSMLTQVHSSQDPPKLDMAAIHCVNDACELLSRGIPARAAVQIALESAQAVDRFIEGLSDDFVLQIESAGKKRLLQRSLHRLHHIEKMTEAAGVKN